MIDDPAPRRSALASDRRFVSGPHALLQIENCMSTYDPQAYIVVYSVVDAGSFAVAEDLLHFLWRCDVISTHAVILVGNKMDLARSRCISSQGESKLRALKKKSPRFHEFVITKIPRFFPQHSNALSKHSRT